MEDGGEATKLVNGVGSRTDDEVAFPYNGVDDVNKYAEEELAELRWRVVELEKEVKLGEKEESVLRALVAELERELKDSEAANKALASHASYLEGEADRLREDLITTQSAAADSEADVVSARIAVEELTQNKASFEKRLALLQAEFKKKEEEVLALDREVAAIKSSAENGSEAFKKRIEELESERDEWNSQLKIKLVGYASRDLAVNENNNKPNGVVDSGAVEEKGSPMISWAMAGGLAASTGAVAVAATTLYLRHARR